MSLPTVGSLLKTRRIAQTAEIEDEKLLASDTRVSTGARLSGEVRTDEGVLIDSNSVIYGPVEIGKRTYVGPNCIIGFPKSAELNKLIASQRIQGKKVTAIGDRCVVRSGTVIYSDVKISDGVAFGHNALVREEVKIGTNTKIGTNVVIDGKTTIGSQVSIQTGVYICTYSTIEDAVFLGPHCVLTNDKYMTQKPFELVGPTIKRGASIGANSLIFPGITVGEGAVVGSQALVNSDVPPRTIFVGIPARKIKEIPRDWHSALLGR